MDAAVDYDIYAQKAMHAMPYHPSLYEQQLFPPDYELQEKESELEIPFDETPSAPPFPTVSLPPLPPPPPPPVQSSSLPVWTPPKNILAESFSFKKHLSRKHTHNPPPKNSSESLVLNEIAQKWDEVFFEGYGADVLIRTENACCIKAHSNVLVATSAVFRHLISESKHVPYEILISGVPFDAAKTFVRFLYSGRCEQDDWRKYVLHLLALSHVYLIPSLKRQCVGVLEKGLLTEENALDVLQLARLCDAPRLSLICLRIVVREFKAVAKSEAWRAMCQSNPSLEQELVEAVIDNKFKEKDNFSRNMAANAYTQILDAVEALGYIGRDGYQVMWPTTRTTTSGKEGDNYHPQCKGIESLARHFSSCKQKASRGCPECKHMWRLLQQLHST